MRRRAPVADEREDVLNVWQDEAGRQRANEDPGLAAAQAAVLEQTRAEASYSSYPVLSVKTARG